jgi:hypothetical protein
MARDEASMLRGCQIDIVVFGSYRKSVRIDCQPMPRGRDEPPYLGGGGLRAGRRDETKNRKKAVFGVLRGV